jgi:hypothetical protein
MAGGWSRLELRRGNMVSTEASDWLYASDLLPRLGEEAPAQVLKQLKRTVDAQDRDAAKR